MGLWVPSAPWHPMCSSSGHILERLGWEDLPGVAKCRIRPGFGQDTSYKTCVACQLPWKCSCSLPGTQLASSFCLPGSGAAGPGTASATPQAQGLALGTGAASSCLHREELPWNSTGWFMCKVETSAALCCHALNLFIYELRFFISICAATRVTQVQICPV